MLSSTITRITTGTFAVLLTGSIAWGIHQGEEAASAREQAALWQKQATQLEQVATQSADALAEAQRDAEQARADAEANAQIIPEAVPQDDPIVIPDVPREPESRAS